jgi:5'-deoxynucleotidase YfbR-like HD superfamily hydrolase
MDNTTRRNIQALRESGKVERNHTTPIIKDHDVAQHSWNMIGLLYQLHPKPSRELILAAAFHDSSERWLGDIPHQVKAIFGDEDYLSKEREVETSIGVFIPITSIESKWLHAVDKLELLMQCYDEYNMGNSGVLQMMENCKVLLGKQWIPYEVQEFVKDYRWERTNDVVDWEIIK